MSRARNLAATPTPPEEDLFLRYRDHGDMAAFETLVREYERPMFHYLFRFLHNAELAAEVFQATFLRVHLKRDYYRPGRPLRPWLYRIATNCAIDALRREGRHHLLSLDQPQDGGQTETTALLQLLESDVPDPAAELDRKERRGWARRAVSRLPEHLRAVVLLLYFQGLKYREAAEALEVPLGTIKSRAHQALLVLNRAWRQDHPRSEEETCKKS